MGFRFFKRVRLMPWVTLNLSSGVPSVSVGPEGAKLTVGGSGTHVTFGVPGTGLFWTSKVGGGSSGSTASPSSKKGSSKGKGTPAPPPSSPAYTAWQAGVVALHEDRLPEAIDQLGIAWTQRSDLPGGSAAVEIPITPELTLGLAPDETGAGLAYAEALQASGRADEAAVVLRTLRAEADSPVVRVSHAELELERGDPEGALAVCGRSRDPLVSLYRARALLACGRPADALAEVSKIRKVAPPELDDELAELEAAARAAS